MRRLAVLLAAFALALAGCGTDEEAADEAAPAEPAVEDCGSYESLNEPLTAQQREMNRCLVEAFEAGEPATLGVTLATVEGDPIEHVFTVTGENEVAVVVDTTMDAYGPRGVQAFTCTGLGLEDGRISWSGCDEVDAPKEPPLTNPQQPS